MRKRRGYILVEVLIVVACLVALMATLTANQRASLQATQDRLRQRRAELAARSAIAYALATLQNANANLVTQNDAWYLLGDRGLQVFDLGDAIFRLEIVDAGSLLNINTATEPQLQLLPLTQEQIDSLLDWREVDLQPRATGAKDEYYNTLIQPYNAKLGRLTVLNELLLIKGWTARELYTTLDSQNYSTTVQPEDTQGNPLPLVGIFTASSGAPNTRADGTTRVNLGQGTINPTVFMQMGLTPVDANLLAAGAPYTSFSDLFSRPGVPVNAAQQLLDAATFSGGTRLEGKINVNMASQSVLETIPNVTPDIASAIVSQQANGFQSLGELASVPGLSGSLLGQVADACAVGCDTWIIRAYGESGGVVVAVEAVAMLTDGRIQIQRRERLNVGGIPAWWGWTEEPTGVMEVGTGR